MVRKVLKMATLLILLILPSVLLSLKMKVKANVTVLKHQLDIASSNEKFQAIVGGFGSGKSLGVVFRSMERLKIRKKAIIAFYAPTYRDLIDTNIPDFEDIFSKYNIKYIYKKSEKKIIVNQGVFTGEIWFRSADKPEGIVGYDATDSVIDEFDIMKPENQRILWRKMLGRMRGSENTTVAVATTPEGFRETYELFEKKKVGPLFRAKTTDNPFLPKDYIDTLYDQFDENLVKQYINAEFVNINGLQAYYGFDRGKNHMSNEEFEEKYGISIRGFPTVCIGMDFNVKKLCAECFIHLPEMKRMHFFNEIILRSSGHSDISRTQQMCNIIKRQFEGRKVCVYPDPTGSQRRTSAVSSDLAILEDNGFRVYANDAAFAVRDRLNSANTMFGKKRATVDTDECPDFTEDLQKCECDKYGEVNKKDEERTHSSDAGTIPIAYLYPIVKSHSVRIVRMS